MAFSDPLRSLGPISPHPAPDSVTGSDLSSALSDPETWSDAQDSVRIVLSSYIPKTPNDDTAKVLRAFVAKLPKDGQLALMNEILFFQGDGKKLRELRNFLVDASLKPSMSMSYFCHFFIYLVSNICFIVKAGGGKEPPAISPAVHANPIDDIDRLMIIIESSIRNDQTALKKACLKRDGYTCVVSGILDRSSVSIHASASGRRVGATDCAHILPFGLRKFDEDMPQQVSLFNL